jgi:ribonuclease T1
VRTLLCLVFALCAAFATPHALGQKQTTPEAAAVALKELPREARETIALVRKGGPFPYARDGAIFSNRESKLPRHARGYYREYTVKTPGERTRGARRIVAGKSGELYYTDDHYTRFRRVLE